MKKIEQEHKKNTWSETLLKTLYDIHCLSFAKKSGSLFVLKCTFTLWVLRIFTFNQIFVCESQEWFSVKKILGFLDSGGV